MPDKGEMGMQDEREIAFLAHRFGSSGFHDDTDPEKTALRNSQRKDIKLEPSTAPEAPLEDPAPMAILAICSQACCSDTIPTVIHWLSTCSETRPVGCLITLDRKSDSNLPSGHLRPRSATYTWPESGTWTYHWRENLWTSTSKYVDASMGVSGDSPKSCTRKTRAARSQLSRPWATRICSARSCVISQ